MAMIRWPILAIFCKGYPPSQITGSTNCCRTTGSPQNNNTPQKELGPQGGLGQGVFTGCLRLMQLLRLKAVIRAPKKYRSYRGKEGRIAPNILMRKFDCEKPNHKWVTDVTEFRVGDEKLYLSPVLDLFNRQIIAYQLMRKPVYKLVSDMLEKAISTLKSTEKPLIHSDQGWQ